MTDDPTCTLRDGRRQGRHAEDAEPIPGLIVLCSESRVVERGPFFAQGELTIGRQADRALYIEDSGMSRHHATVSARAGGLAVCDEGSHNGTSVNGERIEGEAPLAAGDVIRCGTTLLLVVADAEAYRGWPASAEEEPLLGGPAIAALRRAIATLAPQPIDVLIGGESGTGKDVAARLLHERSGRQGAFVPVNCAAIPEALFEAELFGARKGAFSGATVDRLGLMQAARGGTLFLDEVGDLPLAVQPKLLRAVEQREARPLGAHQSVRVDLRLVAATHRDLALEVQAGRFREDLHHRLRGATLEMPPLRARREDVALLALRTIAETARGGDAPTVSSELMERVLLHPWPGNTRELLQAMREAVLRARMEGASELRSSHLRPSVLARGAEEDNLERVRQALLRCQGNVVHAAAELGVDRGQIYRVLREHHLRAADFRRKE